MAPGIAFYICDNYKESKINGQLDEARVHKGLEGCLKKFWIPLIFAVQVWCKNPWQPYLQLVGCKEL